MRYSGEMSSRTGRQKVEVLDDAEIQVLLSIPGEPRVRPNP